MAVPSRVCGVLPCAVRWTWALWVASCMSGSAGALADFRGVLGEVGPCGGHSMAGST